jgi:phosphoribosylaminoimidazole-succinocarboxamide synthase
MNSEAIKETHFNFPGQTNFYKGKVRDVYFFDQFVTMIATDRISAFDVILPRAIPYKGQILNQIATKFLKATKDIVPNWILSSPDPNVSIGVKCEPFMVEMVIRGYLAGHAWREYNAGKRTICGVILPEGLKENDKLPNPIITPTTKAKEGHDMDISKDEILSQGIVGEKDYERLEAYTYALFDKGTKMARQNDLILVDTKYEFGSYEGKIYLIDEIHTPDSSRYFYREGYVERQQRGEKQKQLSKEFVRQWLISEGFQGKEGERMPEMSDEKVTNISERYIELYEKLTGDPFVKQDYNQALERIEKNVTLALQELNLVS